MIHTPAAAEMRSRRVNGVILRAKRNRKRGPLSEEHKRKISEALRGHTNQLMSGVCRDVGDWEARPLYRQMGDQLREHRIALDVSMRELARASGVNEATICRIERGIPTSRRKGGKGPRLETMFRLALALGVRPYELMP